MLLLQRQVAWLSHILFHLQSFLRSPKATIGETLLIESTALSCGLFSTNFTLMPLPRTPLFSALCPSTRYSIAVGLVNNPKEIKEKVSRLVNKLLPLELLPVHQRSRKHRDRGAPERDA